MQITSRTRQELNYTVNKYCGWKYPEEVCALWEELSNTFSIDILVLGYPDKISADGGESWIVSYEIEGKPVTNSRFIFQVYKGNNSLKNEYNIYFS